jgi:hypothetical protein
MVITAVDRIRLAALLGMLGSEHAGERENAAQLVEQFRKQHGVVWTDLLTARGLSKTGADGPTGPSRRPFSISPPGAGDAPSIPRTSASRDAVWRWSMLIGLVVVGSVSVATLLQQRSVGQTIEAKVAMDGRCLDGAEGAGWPACASVLPDQDRIRPLADPAPTVVAAGTVALPTAFAQGLADRKVWETWHKSGTAGLCSGHFRPDQQELKSACVIAGKLLAGFDQRRQSDAAYRRGWNSLAP